MIACPCCGSLFAATTRVFARSRYLAGRIRHPDLIQQLRDAVRATK